MNPVFDTAAGTGIVIIAGATAAYAAGLISSTFVYTVTVIVCAGIGTIACLSDRGAHGFFAKEKAVEGPQALAHAESKLVK